MYNKLSISKCSISWVWHMQTRGKPWTQTRSWTHPSHSLHSHNPPLSLPLSPGQPLTCFPSLDMSYHFLQFYIKRITKYMLFLLVWLFSFLMNVLKFTHVVAHANFTLLFVVEYYSTEGTSPLLHVHPLVDLWGVSKLKLLQTTLMFTFLYKPLCGHRLLFLLSKHLGWNSWVTQYVCV